jgi:hypothetical protein
VSTKFSRRQNSRFNKNLTSTKCWRRRRRISLLFGSAESTAADFSQTSLMISYVSQKMLIPSHAVPKCGVASGHPAFMGGLSPARYRLVRQNIGAQQDFKISLIRQMVNPQILTIVLSRICSLDNDMNIANEGFSLL